MKSVFRVRRRRPFRTRGGELRHAVFLENYSECMPLSRSPFAFLYFALVAHTLCTRERERERGGGRKEEEGRKNDTEERTSELFSFFLPLRLSLDYKARPDSLLISRIDSAGFWYGPAESRSYFYLSCFFFH